MHLGGTTVSDLDAVPVPILAVAGGAGAMGSLFAELLLPRARCCVLFDRFATDEQGAEAPRVALTPLVERLAAALGRQGFETRLFAAGRRSLEDARPVAGRDIRAAPAWLLARRTESSAPWPDAAELSGDVTTVAERLGHRPDLPVVVGFVTPNDAEAVARLADVLLVATHYGDAEQFARTLAPYAAGVRAGTLVADLLSIKAAPLATLCRVFSPGVGVLGMHPLFGRAPADITGLVVAVVPAPDGRPGVAWQSWLLAQLTSLGMLMTPTGAAEHDAAMGFVQALTHFALLCFAYTFVRANQDPTLLLPFRTPVFEPLLYLAARVAALAQRSPEVYRAIQAECTRPELRRLFVETAQELLAAIEADASHPLSPPATVSLRSTTRPDPPSSHLTDLLETLGAPWSPANRRDAEPFEQLVTMSSALTEPINGLRHALLRSAGQIRAIRNTRTGLVTLGMVYIDPLHHDRVDLASRLRYRRFNLTAGTLDGPDQGHPGLLPLSERQRLEAALSSLPLSQVQLLSEADMVAWLNLHAGPRSGPDDRRGAADVAIAPAVHRVRYVGKGHFDLSVEVPDWFDDDCLTRLLVGRRCGGAHLTVARLRRQEATGMRTAIGRIAATVQIATILDPQEVLAIRQRASGSEPPNGGGPVGMAGRQEADRQFAAAIIQRQAEARQAALDWLLAHGCGLLRPA
jgi:prephenate dehydrogenase